MCVYSYQRTYTSDFHRDVETQSCSHVGRPVKSALLPIDSA